MMWDKFAQRLFIEKLTLCEENLSAIPFTARDFVKDMREHYESRLDAMDLGAAHPWEPTVRQLNYLTNIADDL